MLRGLSQYRVLQPLARGGQGEVFLAVDTRLNRRVCIKLYSYGGGVRERRRLQHEAWRLAHIDSPRVVDVVDVVAHGGRLALVTAYVPGSTLTRLLDLHGALPPGDALALASDLAAALAALRRTQLVHGDLSGDNVLVDAGGRAVLVDFGTAVVGGKQPLAVSRPAATPEHLRGDAIDLRTDFFALGVLLYRMLFARHPFFRDGEPDRVRLLRGLRTVPSLEGLSLDAQRDLEALLLRLLASDPRQRPAGTFELRERLRQLRAALPAPAPLRLPAREGAIAPAGPTVLPSRLLRLPWYRQVLAALHRYWRTGSVGARALLLTALLSPLGALALVAADPGPCIAVLLPRYNAGAEALLAAPPQGKLQRMLTDWVAGAAGRALVLGTGPSSDTRWSLTPDGLRNRCVPQRRLAVHLSCVDDRCRIAVRARRALSQRRQTLELSPLVPQREFRDALASAVQEQAAYLLEQDH